MKCDQNIEKVQCRAARWITSHYQQTSCIDSILTDLDWPTLQNRRKKSTTETILQIPERPDYHQLQAPTNSIQQQTQFEEKQLLLLRHS